MHQQQHPKRTVILSDILQSGRVEKELYQEVATALNNVKINRFIGIGKGLLSTDMYLNQYRSWNFPFMILSRFQKEF